MNTDNNKALVVRRYIEDVVNTGDIDHIDEFIFPEHTEIYLGERGKSGVEGAKKHFLGVRVTYPDLHLVVQQQISQVAG